MLTPGSAPSLHPTARLPQPRRKVPSTRYRPKPSHIAAVAILVVVIGLGTYLVFAPQAEASTAQANLSAESPTTMPAAEQTIHTFESLASTDPDMDLEDSMAVIEEFITTTTSIADTTSTLPALPIAPAVDPLERFEVLLVGDSLSAGAEEALRLSLAPAQMDIDAVVGRGLADSQNVFDSLSRTVGEHDIVVIQLGTNDYDFPAGYELMIAGTLALLDHAHCIIWVNTQEFIGHLPELNQAITRQTERIETAFMADWASIADDPGLHLSDGYHLNEKGSRLLATLIVSSVRNNCVPNEASYE